MQIFISYRSDRARLRARGQAVAAILRAQGWQVWFDVPAASDAEAAQQAMAVHRAGKAALWLCADQRALIAAGFTPDSATLYAPEPGPGDASVLGVLDAEGPTPSQGRPNLHPSAGAAATARSGLLTTASKSPLLLMVCTRAAEAAAMPYLWRAQRPNSANNESLLGRVIQFTKDGLALAGAIFQARTRSPTLPSLSRKNLGELEFHNGRLRLLAPPQAATRSHHTAGATPFLFAPQRPDLSPKEEARLARQLVLMERAAKTDCLTGFRLGQAPTEEPVLTLLQTWLRAVAGPRIVALPALDSHKQIVSAPGRRRPSAGPAPALGDSAILDLVQHLKARLRAANTVVVHSALTGDPRGGGRMAAAGAGRMRVAAMEPQALSGPCLGALPLAALGAFAGLGGMLSGLGVAAAVQRLFAASSMGNKINQHSGYRLRADCNIDFAHFEKHSAYKYIDFENCKENTDEMENRFAEIFNSRPHSAKCVISITADGARWRLFDVKKSLGILYRIDKLFEGESSDAKREVFLDINGRTFHSFGFRLHNQDQYDLDIALLDCSKLHTAVQYLETCSFLFSQCGAQADFPEKCDGPSLDQSNSDISGQNVTASPSSDP
jgi:hypothetical protein